MSAIITYIVEVMACSGVFVLFYRTVMHRHTQFLSARVFLLASLVAAAVIPALDIPVWRSEPVEALAIDPVEALVRKPVEALAIDPVEALVRKPVEALTTQNPDTLVLNADDVIIVIARRNYAKKDIADASKVHGLTIPSRYSDPVIILENENRELTKEEFDRIDPNSIESISVLKDRSAIDIYGERAADGVITITTKEADETNEDAE